MKLKVRQMNIPSTPNDHPDPRESHGIKIVELKRAEFPAVVELVARGMRDNPLHVAAYGTDPARRLACHARLIGALLNTKPTLRLFGVKQQDTLLAVAGEAAVGTCQMTPGQILRAGPQVAMLGPRTAVRVQRWIQNWARHDPTEDHVHLGPVAVEPSLQGNGFGSIVVREHCQLLDQSRLVGYLETDKLVNVDFYRRLGYEIVDEGPVLGVPNWFMRRSPIVP
ncbi:GNAT family N-acetyltransferase [Kocuria sp. CPCC 205235]|uniref:GNAT family N-acetyltransferase n=1 Tax=Kocuria sp. CPCC 205235 TaxID=3073549 RepID=UPI0034D3C889